MMMIAIGRGPGAAGTVGLAGGGTQSPSQCCYGAWAVGGLGLRVTGMTPSRTQSSQ